MTAGGRPGILHATVQGVRLIGLAVALFLSVGIPSTYACINVHLGGSAGDPTVNGPGNIVGPGGTVSFSISGLDAGAAWTVTLLGTGQTKSGTGDGRPVSGSFKVPDLGSSPQTLSLQGTATHEEVDGSFWPLGPIQILYRVAGPSPPPPPAAPPPPPPAAIPQPAPPPAVGQAPKAPAPAVGAGPSVGPPRTNPGAGGPPVAPRGSPPSTPPVAASPKRATVTAAVAHAEAEPALRPKRVSAESRVPAARPRVRHLVLPHAVAALPRLEPAPTSKPDERSLWPLLLLVAAAIAGGGAAGGVLLLRRRRPPSAPPRELELEAELQEIIAEARIQRASEDDKSADSLPRVRK